MGSIYKKGVRKEYYIVEKLKKEGYDFVQRTAGSYSAVDIIAIKFKTKEILLIQSKRTLAQQMDFIDSHLKDKLEDENKRFNGKYNVLFKVL